MLRIVSLGGLGHIGGNMMAIETSTAMVLIDCGLLFPNEYQPGVDYVIPDISYVTERIKKLCGVVLTHGHEDHIGAIPYVWHQLGVPIYGSRFTLALVAAKLIEFPECKPCLNILNELETISFGDIAITPIAVTHSIPGAFSLAIKTKTGLVIHTGDFKIDNEPLDNRHTDIDALRAFGDAGVLALLSDSTNIERVGHTYGEKLVERNLADIIRDAPFRVIATTFASNIFRLCSIINASQAAGRKVVLAGRSIEQNVQIAIEQGYLKVNSDTLLKPADFSLLPRSGVTVLAGGSQGEPYSSLSRIANARHADINIEPGDRVILSSRRIPGNDRAVAAVVNNLYRRGAEVIDDRTIGVHASGHAFYDEQKAMLQWCRPQYFIPVHGEYRHLCRHAELARSCGVAAENVFILEDGEPIEFTQKGRKVIAYRGESITAGFVYVDSKRVGEVGETVLRDRRMLAETGIVLCIVVIDENGSIAAGPHVVTRGLMQEDDSQALVFQATAEVKEALSNLEPHADQATRSNEVRLTLRRLIRREFDRRPLIIPVIMSI
ncbi:MAG: ribonuclease J [Deltaproteobacteria bacterium]|nr:ribonuclease J [Deltaproteobacteria bacterium]